MLPGPIFASARINCGIVLTRANNNNKTIVNGTMKINPVHLKHYMVIFAWCATAVCMVSQTIQASEFAVVGPGGGGAMFHGTINPHDANEVLVACDMTGAYVTHDGGNSWRMFNLRGTAQFFAFDPLRPHVIYTGTRASWRSTNNGESCLDKAIHGGRG